MQPSISLWAGKQAFAKIKDSGISPDDVKVVAGAAGGPKWLVLSHLDRALFSSWLSHRKSPLFMIGSSIGAWRLAVVSRKNPTEAINEFQDSYLEQIFGIKPTIHTINRVIEKVLDQLLAAGAPAEILSHPWYRLNIMTVRCNAATGNDKRTRLALALGLAALANTVSRKNLKFFFERTLFYDARNTAPFHGMNEFPINRIPLTAANIKPALMASGSVPLIMPGVENIPGAPSGVYRDGGIIDYHMNINFMDKQDGIVLFPHYTPQIIPGWLDKKVFWRKPNLSYMDQVLMITPSKEFTDSLPYGKISDRSDFTRFAGDDNARLKYWNTVIDAGRRISDEFMEALETGRIKQMVKPI